jgi:hypothetical protein
MSDSDSITLEVTINEALAIGIIVHTTVMSMGGTFPDEMVQAIKSFSAKMIVAMETDGMDEEWKRMG